MTDCGNMPQFPLWQKTLNSQFNLPDIISASAPHYTLISNCALQHLSGLSVSQTCQPLIISCPINHSALCLLSSVRWTKVRGHSLLFQGLNASSS